MNFGILGSGSWGTAIAKILTDNGHTIYWWNRSEQAIAQFKSRHHNPQYLTSARFDINKLKLTSNVSEVINNADCIVIAIPSAYALQVLNPLDKNIFHNKKIVSAIKGILPEQNLLLNGFETPVLEHEAQWIEMVNLAYVQLWAAHLISVVLPRPWETNLKQSDPSARISPSKVQQGWNSIISQLGTPAVSPKPRGISQGRQLGQSQTPRPRMPVIKKGKFQNTVPPIAA